MTMGSIHSVSRMPSGGRVWLSEISTAESDSIESRTAMVVSSTPSVRASARAATKARPRLSARRRSKSGLPGGHGGG